MTRTRSLRWVLAVAMVLAAGFVATPARAQLESREAIALRDQIAELRQEVRTLAQQVANGRGGSMLGAAVPMQMPQGGAPSNDVTAQLLVRVEQMEGQIRDLHGRVDELQNQLQQQTADLGKRIDDLTFLVENPKAAAAAAAAAARKAAASAPPATQGPSPNPAPPPLSQTSSGVLGTLPEQPQFAPPPTRPSNTAQQMATQPFAGAPPARTPRTPELAMQEGTAALARRDYATAETTAHEILNGNRTSPRAYDAMFLLAQAQYGERQYSQAALSYDDTYNRARKGPHAEDSLLGLANSLVGLNDRPSACQAIAKLRAEFPAQRPEFRDQVAATHQRAGCR